MRPVLIALLAALAVAPAAHAEPRFRDIGPVVDGPYTDGHRWAAWSPVLGKLTLFDTERGRAWTQPLRPECHPAAVGGGRLLLACARPAYPDESYRRPLLVDLRTGASWEPPGVDAALAPIPSASDQGVRWTGVGRSWLHFVRSGYHWQISGYLDIASGRLASDPASPVRQPSLDAPGLLVRLCSPLHRPLNPNNDVSMAEDPRLTLDYEPPWALVRAPDGTVALAHCGRTTKRALCNGVCDAALSAGVVTWSTPRELNALVLATGQALRWRGSFQLPVHTANRVFATRWRAGAGRRLLMARLPSVNK